MAPWFAFLSHRDLDAAAEGSAPGAVARVFPRETEPI
jgi:hypothetical protein